MVGWRAVHHRGLSFLLGRRRQQQGDFSVRVAAGAAGPRQGAALRGAQRDGGTLHLGRAEPAIPRSARGSESALPLPSGALSEEIPPQIHRRREGQCAGERLGIAQLGGPVSEERRAVPLRQSRPAHARAVGEYDAAAVDALRAGAQPLFSSRRQVRPAAPVHRPRDRRHQRGKADSGEGRRRRRRPAGALPALRQLHVPQAEREAQPLQGAAVGEGARIAGRPLSESQRRRSRMAQVDARRALPARALARGQPPRDQRGRLFRPRRGVEQHGAQDEPALPRRVPQRVEPIRRQGGQQAAR